MMIAIPWTPLAVTLSTLGCEYANPHEPCWNTFTPEQLKKYSIKLGRQVTLKNALDLGIKPQTVWFFKDTPELRALMAAYTEANERKGGDRTEDNVPNEAYARMAAVLFANRSVTLDTIQKMPPKLKGQMPDGTWYIIGKDCPAHVRAHFGLA